MARRYCAQCGLPVTEDCRVCPHCGKVVTAQRKRSDGGRNRAPYSPYGGTPPRSGTGYGRQKPRPAGHSPAPQRRNTGYNGYGGYDEYDGYDGYDNYRGHDGYDSYGGYGYDGYGNNSYSRGYERAPQRRQPQRPQRTQRPQPRQAAPRPAPQPKARPKPAPAPEKRSRLKAIAGTTSKIFHAAVTVVKVAVLLAVLYAGVFLIQIYRVKLTPYPYKTSMTLSCSNYGQAISGYFDSGKWSVNPFTGKCTYSGDTHHHEEMTLTFTARSSVELTEITIDGEPVSDRLLESKIMGMFI